VQSLAIGGVASVAVFLTWRVARRWVGAAV
jgi:hypothetical protein